MFPGRTPLAGASGPAAPSRHSHPQAAAMSTHDPSHVSGTLHKNVVVAQKVVVVVDLRFEIVEKLAAHIDEIIRQVVGDPTDRDVAVGQPGAARRFEQIEQHLPFTEAV